MNKAVALYKSYLPILILIVYSVGYIFLINYYLNFGIEIVFFLSLTDILFTALDLLVTFITLVVLLEIVMLIVSSVLFAMFSNEKDKEINSEKEKENRKTDEYYLSSNDKFKLVSLTLTIIILVILISYTDNSFFFGLTLFTLLPIKIYNLIGGFDNNRIKEDEDQYIELSKFRTGLAFFLIIVLIIGAYIFGNNAAKRVKNKNSPFLEIDIEFNDGEISYSTELDSTKLFIGQSSDYIFIYNIPTEKTLVFNKSSLKNLKFKDPTREIENRVENQIESIKKVLQQNDSIRKQD